MYTMSYPFYDKIEPLETVPGLSEAYWQLVEFLHIKNPPAVVLVDMTYHEVNGFYNFEKNEIHLMSYPGYEQYIFSTLAHEMRHAWQAQAGHLGWDRSNPYHVRYKNRYYLPQVTVFNWLPYENDANWFMVRACNRFGWPIFRTSMN